MKKKDRQLLREKGIDELKASLKKKREGLFNLRLDKSKNKLKDIRSLFWIRKEIAYIQTIISEKELMQDSGKGAK